MKLQILLLIGSNIILCAGAFFIGVHAAHHGWPPWQVIVMSSAWFLFVNRGHATVKSLLAHRHVIRRLRG